MSEEVEKQDKPFSGLRGILWPIHNYELKKFLPMSLIMMCILFNYSLLRNIKDAIVVTGIGAETLNVIKLWLVFPSAVLFMSVYYKLVNSLSRDAIFYTLISIFVSFFLLFGFVLYPMEQCIHFDLSSLEATYPFLKWPSRVIGKWSYSMFYVMSELWGTVCLTLLFWQFANSVTPAIESKRFYPMFGFVGNIALILSGLFGMALEKILNSDAGGNNWAVSLKYAVISVAISAMLAIILYRWMQNNVLNDKKYYDPDQMSGSKKSKAKLSIGDSIKYVLNSKHIMYIAMLVMGYGISINLIEGIWKSNLGKAYVDPDKYFGFMATFQIWQGIATMLITLVGVNIVRILGWLKGAISTPVTNLIIGTAFICINVFDVLDPSTAVLVGVVLGTFHNIVTKAVKYSLFDPTREMAYIPLDYELKTKGKAAVDVVGGRAGKAGGAFIQFVLLNIICPGSLLKDWFLTIGVIFVFIIVLWIISAYRLDDLLKKTSQDEVQETK